MISLGDFSGVDVPEYEAILNCMQCGMCLPHCPTYSLTKIERSSPRGRVALIRAVADGRLDLSEGVAKELFFCLDCRACETVCPASVRVGYLIEAGRSQVEQHRPRPIWQRALRRLVFENLFRYTPRLERLAFLLRIYQKMGLRRVVHESGMLNMLPPVFRFMEELTPDGIKRPLRRTVAEEIPPHDEEHARVGFFLGCMMSILFPDASRATVNLLAGSGCRVITPKSQLCCGAPLASEGYKSGVLDLARFNIDLFEKQNVDYIVTDCAACGCVLKEYEELFQDDPNYCERARVFSNKVRDISQFLAEWPHYREPRDGHALRCLCGSHTKRAGDEKPLRIAYDEPCHLQHAQRITKQPNQLLRQIPGVTYVSLPESDWCCGSAGLYNISHFETSMQLLDRKMAQIERVSPDVLVTANPGCLLQLGYGVRKRNLPIRVLHLSEILAAAGNDGYW
ncbi:MAG: (Fe-S)-binding protein [bacterium]